MSENKIFYVNIVLVVPKSFTIFQLICSYKEGTIKFCFYTLLPTRSQAIFLLLLLCSSFGSRILAMGKKVKGLVVSYNW